MPKNNSSVFFDFEEKDVLKITISGEIDHHNAIGIRSCIDDMLIQKCPKKVFLNLSTIDFMDSSGLGLVMGRYATMKKIGGELIIVNPSKRVLKILELSNMDKMLTILKKEVIDNEIVR